MPGLVAPVHAAGGAVPNLLILRLALAAAADYGAADLSESPMRTYAIGDIHGHLDLLQDLHARIATDQQAVGDGQGAQGIAPIVHVGDLVDRGPNSRGVLDYLRAGIASGKAWVVLKGNHDRMFAGFVGDMRYHDAGLRADLSWLHPRLGGAATLASYGVRNAAERPIAPVHVEARALVPPDHCAFIDALPTLYQRGDVVYAHAGIRPGVPLADQAETDLLWIRAGFLDDHTDHGPLIVHGHTALDAPCHYGNRLNIDSGAAYGGPLTAVVIEGRDVFHLTNQGRKRLLPL